VATITRRPEHAQRLASKRTGRAHRRHVDREQRGDRRHADRPGRTSRPRQPQERGMLPMPADPSTRPARRRGAVRVDLLAYPELVDCRLPSRTLRGTNRRSGLIPRLVLHRYSDGFPILFASRTTYHGGNQME
jgi:hypothetical protein